MENVNNSGNSKKTYKVNENGKVSVYNPSATKKYKQKLKRITLEFSLLENDLVREMESAISESGMSTSAWIKTAIREKLNRDNS